MAGRQAKNAPATPAVEEAKATPVAEAKEAPAAETKESKKTVDFTVRQNQLTDNDKLPGKKILSIRYDDKYYSTVVNAPDKQVNDATKVRKGVAKADQEPMTYQDKDGNTLQYKSVRLTEDTKFTNKDKETGEITSVTAGELKSMLNQRSADKAAQAEASAENVKEAPVAEVEASK